MTLRILVVDDSKLARMAVTKILMTVHPDWTRVEAANADEALAQVQKSAVDLALLDFNMPGRDGLVLAAEIQKLKPDMPLAVISANHQTEIVSRAQALGAAFLSKPLTEAALRDFLKTAETKIAGSR
jgi:CheY-like chemotaxis protein